MVQEGRRIDCLQTITVNIGNCPSMVYRTATFLCNDLPEYLHSYYQKDRIATTQGHYAYAMRDSVAYEYRKSKKKTLSFAPRKVSSKDAALRA